ncbi:MAG: transposase [Syntrophaceae bacterium]|nr:transposase [Syntrophaceae bacterium]
MAVTRVWLDCRYRKFYCAACRRIVIEDLELFDPYLRITRRLAVYIPMDDGPRCRPAPGPGLEDGQGGRQALFRGPIRQTRPCGPSHPGVDEISILKGHRYLTVVLNYETAALSMSAKIGKPRPDALLQPAQCGGSAALKPSPWTCGTPYIKAVKKLPAARIVFDLFHVVAAFNRVIDAVRNSEHRKAQKEHKALYKGAKYLLLKNRRNLRRRTTGNSSKSCWRSTSH